MWQTKVTQAASAIGIQTHMKKCAASDYICARWKSEFNGRSVDCCKRAADIVLALQSYEIYLFALEKAIADQSLFDMHAALE